MIRRVWAIIPDEYKHPECRPAYRLPDPARLSPNEGVRCREIPRIARETLRIVHERRSGAVDWPLFQRLLLPSAEAGADPARVRESRILADFIRLLESMVMERGILDGHGMTFLAEKRA